MNMGIEPFLVTSAVNLIAAQRLVRRVCTNCGEQQPTAASALEEIGFTAKEAGTVVPLKGAGCEKCNDTGYKGRIALYEVMEINSDLRELENVIERAVALEESDKVQAESLDLGDIPGQDRHFAQYTVGEPPVATGGSSEVPERLPESGFVLEQHVQSIEREYLANALEQAGGVKVRAAGLLGMSFRSFRYYLKKYQLS